MSDQSIIRRIQSLQLHEKTLYSTPICAKIEVSGICNLNCRFCYKGLEQNQSKRSRIILSQDFSKIRNFLKSISTIREVGLFYIGESALNPLLPEFANLLKNDNYFVFLTTNGTIRDIILEAIENIDSLKVSFNYSSEEDFSRKTGKDSYLFYQIVENINLFYDKCHSFGKKLSISTILDQEKENFSKILDELKYDEHYFLPLFGFNGINLAGQNGNSNNELGFQKCNALPCWSLFNTVYIDSLLNVRMCSFSTDENQILYNLNSVDNYQITDKMISLRQMHLSQIIPKECKKCFY